MIPESLGQGDSNAGALFVGRDTREWTRYA
jgi:hypothetical protein